MGAASKSAKHAAAILWTETWITENQKESFQQINFLLLFTHLHIIPNPHAVISFSEIQKGNLRNIYSAFFYIARDHWLHPKVHISLLYSRWKTVYENSNVWILVEYSTLGEWTTYVFLVFSLTDVVVTINSHCRQKSCVKILQRQI